MSFALKDIKLGKIDAKREIIALPNFEEYYFDYNEITTKVLDPLCFLVLGKKGTGKTLLAEFLKKQSEKDFGWFLRLESYKRFSLTEMKALKTGDISTEEYIPIWKWIILIELAKMCIENESLYDLPLYSTLKDFLDKNGFSNEINSFKTVSIVKSNEYFIGFNKSGFKGKSEENYEELSYLDLIEPLERIIIRLLSDSNHRYNIIFDELDDKFDGSSNYKNSIICLLKVVDELNFRFLDNNINFKILVMLRRDIVKTLSYSDLNKIIEDSSITLEWGTRENITSPLLRLLSKKISKSSEKFKDLSHEEILKAVFDNTKISISKKRKLHIPLYILSRTLLRPRDLINFIDKIIQQYGNKERITKEMVENAESKYSHYLENEIRDELNGHLEHDEINQFFTLLRHYCNTEFKLQELKEYISDHKNTFPFLSDDANLEKIIRAFYKAGALGSKRFNKNAARYDFLWEYKDGQDSIPLDETFCIHNGLRKGLKLR